MPKEERGKKRSNVVSDGFACTQKVRTVRTVPVGHIEGSPTQVSRTVGECGETSNDPEQSSEERHGLWIYREYESKLGRVERQN